MGSYPEKDRITYWGRSYLSASDMTKEQMDFLHNLNEILDAEESCFWN